MTPMQLNPVDAAWLHMESPETPMHVGVMAIFSKPRNASATWLTDLATGLRERTDLATPWNYRPVRGVVSRLLSRMEEDQQVELDYHFRHTALPEPGGERELGVVVSRLHSNALDRSRPLWEIHLIEGLEGDRFAFYLKLHHALVGGINAIPMFLKQLSASARSRNMAPPWTIPLENPVSGPRDFDPLETASSLGKAGLGLLRNGLSRSRSGSFVVPRGAPYSTLNLAITAQRRFATWQFEQPRIERVAAATDSTVNEILTFLCGSSLRRFFKEYNALPDESLVGLIPVSLQERGEHNPGGAIAAIRVELGTQIGNPVARLEAVKGSIAQVREDRQSLPEDAANSYALLRAAPILMSQARTVGRLVPPLFNLHISNTPGEEKPLYFNGARLEAVYPLTQLMQYTALSIDCVSYAGTLNIGFTGARDTLPHLQRMAVYLGRALEDLEERVYATEESP